MAWFPGNVFFLLLLCKIIFQGPCGILGFLVFELYWAGLYFCFVTFDLLCIMMAGCLTHALTDVHHGLQWIIFWPFR
jgi:hypothetical protein